MNNPLSDSHMTEVELMDLLQLESDEELVEESIVGVDLVPVSKDVFKKYITTVASSRRVVMRKDLAGRTVYTSPSVGGVVGRINNSTLEVNKKLLIELRKELCMKASDIIEHVSAISEGRDKTSTRLAMARSATDTNPTEKEIEDDSYDKGKLSFHGIPIAIENPKGSTRSGTDPSGKRWEVVMQHDYGEILRSDGADGDPVDVFIGDQVESKIVYVVDQFIDDKFDEHKVMLGFTHVGEAKDGYLINYDDDWKGLKWITPASIPDLKDWLNNGDQSKPFNDWSMNMSESKMITANNIINMCESLHISESGAIPSYRTVKSDMMSALIKHGFTSKEAEMFLLGGRSGAPELVSANKKAKKLGFDSDEDPTEFWERLGIAEQWLRILQDNM